MAHALQVWIIAVIVLICQARYNGVGRLPLMGWNTWCTWSSCHQPQQYSHEYHDVCSEEMVKSVAQAIIDSGMQAAGYEYINLDDCWEAVERAADGSMQADPERFTNGTLKPLADWLHERDFKFGMYTAAGEQTCSTGNRSIPNDPDARGVPGSIGHYQQDANTFAAWGVDYVKMDWCTKLPNNGTLALAMAQALNQTGRPMWLNFHCDGTYAPWCPIAGNSWRMAEDHHDNWEDTADVIDKLKDLAPNAGPYRWNDPDFLMTGGAGCDDPTPGKRCPGQTDTEYKTEFSLWSMAAAPLLVSTDIRNMTDVMKDILLNKEIIAIQQDELGKAGGLVQEVDCNDSSDQCQVWARPLANGDFAVAFYNKGNQTGTGDINLEFAGIEPNIQVSIRDLWAHRDLGEFSTTFSSKAKSHETRMYRIRPHL